MNPSSGVRSSAGDHVSAPGTAADPEASCPQVWQHLGPLELMSLLEVEMDKEVGDFTNVLPLSLPRRHSELTERERYWPRADYGVHS